MKNQPKLCISSFLFIIFMVMQTIIVKPESPEQIKTVKAFLNALKIKFKEEAASPYKPEFVAKIKQGEKDKKAGRYKTIKTTELWK